MKLTTIEGTSAEINKYLADNPNHSKGITTTTIPPQPLPPYGVGVAPGGYGSVPAPGSVYVEFLNDIVSALRVHGKVNIPPSPSPRTVPEAIQAIGSILTNSATVGIKHPEWTYHLNVLAAKAVNTFRYTGVHGTPVETIMSAISQTTPGVGHWNTPLNSQGASMWRPRNLQMGYPTHGEYGHSAQMGHIPQSQYGHSTQMHPYNTDMGELPLETYTALLNYAMEQHKLWIGTELAIAGLTFQTKHDTIAGINYCIGDYAINSASWNIYLTRLLQFAIRAFGPIAFTGNLAESLTSTIRRGITIPEPEYIAESRVNTYKAARLDAIVHGTSRVINKLLGKEDCLDREDVLAYADIDRMGVRLLEISLISEDKFKEAVESLLAKVNVLAPTIGDDNDLEPIAKAYNEITKDYPDYKPNVAWDQLLADLGKSDEFDWTSPEA